MSVIKKIGGQDWSVELIDYSEPDLRPKAFYYRSNGMQVGPWACDPKSQKHYLARGFLLEPPDNGKPLKKLWACPVCGKAYDNLDSLLDCLQFHKREEKDGIS